MFLQFVFLNHGESRLALRAFRSQHFIILSMSDANDHNRNDKSVFLVVSENDVVPVRFSH